MSILTDPPIDDVAAFHAVNFVRGMKAGLLQWEEREQFNHTEWPADGFVYFAAIGSPYVTHVKIGFTKGDPEQRVKSLQTGCPYPIRLLGYVFGTTGREAELHDVFKDERCQGEWFEYSDYVAGVIAEQLAQGVVR